MRASPSSSPPPERILVYDGDCSSCVRLSRPAAWRWLVGRAQRRPFAAFEGEDAARLLAAGVHNELAVLAPASGEIRSGYDGILWLLEGGRLRWLVPLLRLPPVRWVLRHDYRLVAYNRRIFAPPARGVACVCDPDLHRGYRIAFVVLALLWTGLFATLAAALFWTRGPFWPTFPLHAETASRAWLAGVAALLGWALTAAAALRLPRERRLDHVGHVAWIYAAMLLPLLLATALALAGLLLAHNGTWYGRAGVPLGVGAAAWGLALPIALFSGLRRLPRLGFAKRTAAFLALGSWLLPTALFPLLLPLPFHGP